MNMEVQSSAVILGGYVNGYSIIQELHEKGVKNISLLYYNDKNQIASYSNKLSYKRKIHRSKESLLNALIDLKKKYSFLVLFPTDDTQVELLAEFFEKIKSFCFVPFNVKKIEAQSDKFIQYQYCDNLGIPYPKTIEINEEIDTERLLDLEFPIIVKPKKRDDLKIKVFRNKIVENKKELDHEIMNLKGLVRKGLSFIASEIIPGSSNGNIFAYTAYRNKNGQIVNEWVGKKLTQFPDDFGIFSTASNQAPDIVKEQGRKLLTNMDLFGICEPEFKYDHRDGRFKLMEINLRSMMWHRVGALSGVFLHFSQWQDALGLKPKEYSQKIHQSIHFSYLSHEIVNLIVQKNYYKNFKQNLFRGDLNALALYDKKDLLPFLYDLLLLIPKIAKAIIKRLFLKK